MGSAAECKEGSIEAEGLGVCGFEERLAAESVDIYR